MGQVSVDPDAELIVATRSPPHMRATPPQPASCWQTI